MFRTIIKTDIAGGADIALIQTAFGFHVRYGLEVSEAFFHIADARRSYDRAVTHALECSGFHDDEDEEDD